MTAAQAKRGMVNTIPRVLSIAGTDPTGGAGIQADLKSIGALGGYGMAVITALVAQNTRGVRGLHVPPTAFLVEQLRAVSDDVTIDAVKIGMLQSTGLVDAVTTWLDEAQPPVVVLDPVMVATSGDRLLDADAESAIRALCARAHLVTPNLAELAVLTDGKRAHSWIDAIEQARALHTATGTTVLVKGGHLEGGRCPDAIVGRDGVHEEPGRRLETRHTHGTGCSLSSAMATLAAAGLSWPEALMRAKLWLTGAIEHADALEVGHGSGPIDHFHEFRHRPAPATAPPPVNAEVSWSQRAWRRTVAVRDDVDACAFVAGLSDGSLDLASFRWYLAQDAIYLREYSRVLARASALAPDVDAQSFWAHSAESALVEEARLHRDHLGKGWAGDTVDTRSGVQAGNTTIAYVNHLRSAEGYAEIVGALLPCFWLYTDIGRRLRGTFDAEHPYADWLSAYGDPAFAQATDRAIGIADRVAAAASDTERNRMDNAFDRSMRHELEFFQAPVGRRLLRKPIDRV